MAQYGPIPKRSDHRRRRNLDQPAITKINVPEQVEPAGPDLALNDPHPLAADWYEALRTSGQAYLFEPSDWAQARVWTEILSRAMKQGDRPSAVFIAAWHPGAAELLTTEGARRRVQIELERQPERDAHRERAEATVSDIQNRLMGRSGNVDLK
jgi:hypothetical protein